MKLIMLFPLEQQLVAAPDGVPRATCALPNGAKVVHLGQAFPLDIIGIFAVVDPPQSAGPGQPPMFKDVGRHEFALVGPGGVVPDGFIFRAPIRTRTKAKDEKTGAETYNEGLLFIFEKESPKLTILTPGGRG